MAGPITRGLVPRLLQPGLHNIFGSQYQEYQQEWRQIFDQLTSSQAFEIDVLISPTGMAVKKEEGDGVTYDSMKQEYEVIYTHMTYALGFIISEEAQEDNLYEKFSVMYAAALGRSGRITKETVLTNILNRGFDAAYPGGDGVALFSASHPILGSLRSNIPAVGIDFSELALETAAIDIGGFVNPRGQIIAQRPVKVIIPRQLEFTAKRIFDSILRVNTANNDINALKALNTYSQGYVVNHFLSSSKAWFIKTDAPQGFQMFQRREPTFAVDNDFDTGNGKHKFTERFSGGMTDWRGGYACPGA